MAYSCLRFCAEALYLATRRGVLCIQTHPVRAVRFDLEAEPVPTWRECFPRLRFDEMFRLIDRTAAPITSGAWVNQPALLDFVTPRRIGAARRAAAYGSFFNAVGHPLCRKAPPAFDSR